MNTMTTPRSQPVTTTAAERLLELAEEVLHPREQVIRLAGPLALEVGTFMARVKAALDLKRRPPVFVLRAITEDWSYERIIRELY